MPRRSLGFALAVCALALASCVSPEEVRREDEATCTGFGFHPGTDGFANCLQKESLARRYNAAVLVLGLGFLVGRGLGAVLAVAAGSFRANADLCSVTSRTWMSSGLIPSTPAIAFPGSAPWRTRAFDQRLCRLGL